MCEQTGVLLEWVWFVAPNVEQSPICFEKKCRRERQETIRNGQMMMMANLIVHNKQTRWRKEMNIHGDKEMQISSILSILNWLKRPIVGVWRSRKNNVYSPVERTKRRQFILFKVVRFSKANLSNLLITTTKQVNISLRCHY